MENYPFLQFWSVVAIPTAYWVGVIETGVLYSQDNTFSLTFGQVSLVPFQFASLWYDPHLPILPGLRCVYDGTSDHRSDSFGSWPMALVYQPAFGPVHHKASGSGSFFSRGDGNSER